MHLIHPASRTKPRFGVRKTRNKRGNGPPSSPPTSSPHRWRAFRPPLRSSRLGPSPSQSRPPASRPFPDARPAPTSDSLSRLSPQKLPSPARPPARSHLRYTAAAPPKGLARRANRIPREILELPPQEVLTAFGAKFTHDPGGAGWIHLPKVPPPNVRPGHFRVPPIPWLPASPLPPS